MKQQGLVMQLTLPFNAPVVKPQRSKSASAQHRASTNVAASVVIQEIQRRHSWSHEQMAKKLGLSPHRLRRVVNRTTRDVAEIFYSLSALFPDLNIDPIIAAAHCRAPLSERIARAKQAAQDAVA